MSAPRILYVDDDSLFLLSMGEALEGYGYTVRTAQTPETGEALIRSEPFDAYIFDLELDGDGSRHGLELIAQARAALGESGRHAPILLVSGRSDEDALDLARKGGASACLEKPVSARTLAITLAAHGTEGGLV